MRTASVPAVRRVTVRTGGLERSRSGDRGLAEQRLHLREEVRFGTDTVLGPELQRPRPIGRVERDDDGRLARKPSNDLSEIADDPGMGAPGIDAQANLRALPDRLRRQ